MFGKKKDKKTDCKKISEDGKIRAANLIWLLMMLKCSSIIKNLDYRYAAYRMLYYSIAIPWIKDIMWLRFSKLTLQTNKASIYIQTWWVFWFRRFSSFYSRLKVIFKLILWYPFNLVCLGKLKWFQNKK